MYDKDTLAKSTGASLGVVAIVGMLFLSSGMAFATPIANIGGFQVQADSVAADNFILYPGSAQTSNSSGGLGGTADANYPMAVNELENATIKGFALVKTVDISELTGNDGGLAGEAAIVVASNSTVTANSILLKTPALSADSASFSGLSIYEEGASDLQNTFTLKANKSVSQTFRLADDPESSLSDLTGSQSGVTGPDSSNAAVYLQNANIQAAYLVTSQITLNNLGVEVWYDGDDDGDYEVGGSPNTQGAP